jgi:hypothetical protein
MGIIQRVHSGLLGHGWSTVHHRESAGRKKHRCST